MAHTGFGSGTVEVPVAEGHWEEPRDFFDMRVQSRLFMFVIYDALWLCVGNLFIPCAISMGHVHCFTS